MFEKGLQKHDGVGLQFVAEYKAAKASAKFATEPLAPVDDEDDAGASAPLPIHDEYNMPATGGDGAAAHH